MVPGIPKILTNIIVKKFKPMWKLKYPPIKFMSRMSKAPRIEFNNILPNKL